MTSSMVNLIFSIYLLSDEIAYEKFAACIFAVEK
jgi:hypothetical protein